MIKDKLDRMQNLAAKIIDAPIVWVFTPDYGVVLNDATRSNQVIALGDAPAPKETEFMAFIDTLDEQAKNLLLSEQDDRMGEDWLVPLERCETNAVTMRVDSGAIEDALGNAYHGAMVASISDEDMTIFDPYISSCTRFSAHPNQYGLSESQGNQMVAHNLDIGMALFSVEEKSDRIANKPKAG